MNDNDKACVEILTELIAAATEAAADSHQPKHARVFAALATFGLVIRNDIEAYEASPRDARGSDVVLTPAEDAMSAVAALAVDTESTR